jgi:hypothetical protein
LIKKLLKAKKLEVTFSILAKDSGLVIKNENGQNLLIPANLTNCDPEN